MYFVWPILMRTARKLGIGIKYDLANKVSLEQRVSAGYTQLMPIGLIVAK